MSRAPGPRTHFSIAFPYHFGSGPREHHKAALSPTRVSQRWSIVRLPGTAVTGSLRGMDFEADFGWFSWIHTHNTSELCNIYLKIGQKHGIVNLLFWVNHIVLNQSVRKCFYRVFTWNGEYFQCQHSWNENHNLGHDFEISENLYVYLYLKIS